MTEENKNRDKFIDKRLIKEELPRTFAGFIVGAFTLVAGLAWNEAIKQLFGLVFKEQGNLISLFLYAVLVTIIAVLVARRLGRKIEK